MRPALGTLPQLPAIVEGHVSHTRRGPVKHRFRYRIYQWLVDLDDLPRMNRWLRPFSTFKAADHLGTGPSLRENVEQFFASEGLDVSDHRIVMLANARVLGYTFDPLSVFWAIAPDGSLTGIVAEVHNTYGEMHAYLIRPDSAGRDSVDKAFYVSPFFTVDGRYDLRFELSDTHVAATVVLRQDGQPVFAATFRGVAKPATNRRLARLLVTHPLMTQRTSALIRIHGIWLWIRRLPVVKRRPHQHQEAVR